LEVVQRTGYVILDVKLLAPARLDVGFGEKRDAISEAGGSEVPLLENERMASPREFLPCFAKQRPERV
jgi:hypothetical protein